MGFHFLVFTFLYNNMGYTYALRYIIYTQGETEEALSKRWEFEIHISYSGVSANADLEGYSCFNLCFPPGSKTEDLQLGIHLILLYFIRI